jgi:GNAT superfamily N-acetyltransferase
MDIRSDAFPENQALNTLRAAAWGQDLEMRDWTPVLERSLTHLCAFDGDELIGFVNVAWDGGGHAFVLDLCVHPLWQRQGIATRLVRDAVAGARARGVAWVHVDYVADLAGFYQACGFRPTEAGVISLHAGEV